MRLQRPLQRRAQRAKPRAGPKVKLRAGPKVKQKLPLPPQQLRREMIGEWRRG